MHKLSPVTLCLFFEQHVMNVYMRVYNCMYMYIFYFHIHIHALACVHYNYYVYKHVATFDISID